MPRTCPRCGFKCIHKNVMRRHLYDKQGECPPPESIYQNVLEKYLDGKHISTEYGITDVTTNRLHAEIKSWCLWKTAIGQLMAYNLAEPREELHVYLFGKKLATATSIFRCFRLMRIKCFYFDKVQNVVMIRDSDDNVVYTTVL